MSQQNGSDKRRMKSHHSFASRKVNLAMAASRPGLGYPALYFLKFNLFKLEDTKRSEQFSEPF